jgi:predicted ribosomally synthesized peptide with SipW-like signal peptide
MERHSLRVVIVLGVLITLLGGTGIFATFTDRATAGQNTVTSGSRPHAADLTILTGGSGPFPTCNDPMLTFLQNTTTPQFVLSDVQPGAINGPAWVCLRNEGSAPLNITVSAIDITDQEDGCTGDEAANGDTTCGAGDPGELSPLLNVSVLSGNACTGMGISSDTHALTGLTAAPVDFGAIDTLAPTTIECIGLRVEYPASTPESQVQVAQSDSVTWRFAFDGTAP